MRERLLLFAAALIIVCVAGAFYVEAHRYTFFQPPEGGRLVKADHVTGRVWLVQGKDEFELGWNESRIGEQGESGK